MDHRGSVGLLLGSGLQLETLTNASSRAVISGREAIFDLGGTYAVGYAGNELVAWGRLTLGAPQVGWGVVGAYRAFFGAERLKSFLDLGLAVNHWPTQALTVGPRLALGIEVEVFSLLGVYAGVGGQAGFGGAFRWSGEFFAGLQLRSYLLE